MKLNEAEILAEEILLIISPHCEQACIGGSIRRRKEDNIKDIEIICIPKPYEIGMFETGIATVINKMEKIRGSLPCLYTQRLHKGIKVDFFFADRTNFGNILLIRTGCAEFSKIMMGTLLPRHGYKAESGHVYKDGVIIPCETEQSVFDLVKLKYIEPENRTDHILSSL